MSVQLQFRGVGSLHQGYFSESKMVGPLGTTLGQCIDEEARVRISWDSENRIGYITLTATPDELGACLPKRTDGGWDVRPLAPIGRALATYRDGVAGAFDLRVASFRVEVELLRGVNLCTLRAGGQFPPTGEQWSPCVKFEGNEQCEGRDATDGVETLSMTSKSHNAKLASCFGS